MSSARFSHGSVWESRAQGALEAGNGFSLLRKVEGDGFCRGLRLGNSQSSRVARRWYKRKCRQKYSFSIYIFILSSAVSLYLSFCYCGAVGRTRDYSPLFGPPQGSKGPLTRFRVPRLESIAFVDRFCISLIHFYSESSYALRSRNF